MGKFLIRYFIHRTGVEPKKDLRDYLAEELNKAGSNHLIFHENTMFIYLIILDARQNCQSLEDKFMVCINKKDRMLNNGDHVYLIGFSCSIR
jgi:hypothetical protein